VIDSLGGDLSSYSSTIGFGGPGTPYGGHWNSSNFPFDTNDILEFVLDTNSGKFEITNKTKNTTARYDGPLLS